MISVRRVDDLDALAPHKETWNALVRRNKTNTVYQTYEWHRCWLHAFGAEAQALVLLAEEDGNLVGIAPLVLSEPRVLGRRRKVVEFIGASIYTPCDFILDDRSPGALPAMLQWLLEHRHLWSLLLLTSCPNEGRLARVSERLACEGMRSHQHAITQASNLTLGDREADRKVLRKRTIRENQSKLRRLGDLQWIQCTDPLQILGYLDTLFRLHVQRWEGTATPSQFLEAPYVAFHRELVAAMAPAGWPRLSALLLDGEPIGLWLYFDYDHQRYLFRTTYDARWSRYSPGLVALQYLLEEAIEKQIAEVDFGTGHEGYKSRFRNQVVPYYELRVSRNTLAHAIDSLLLRILHQLESHPAVWKRVRDLIAPLQDH